MGWPCEGKAVHPQNLASQQGLLQGEVELKGEGPFSLNLQLAAQPDYTASLPIVGSRRQDREKTLLSNLGRTVECSLLPSENSVEVRGLHLEEGGQRTSPLRLERVDSQTVRLRSATAVQGLVVCLSDPTFPGLKAPPAADFHPEQADEDARLLSTETASSWLAGAIKRTAEEFQQKTEEPVSLAWLREKLEEANWRHWVDSRPPTDPFSRPWREPIESPAPARHFDPFAPDPADPFASFPDPFGAPADPFGAPADPFAAPTCDPFAAPAAMDPFASPTPTPTPEPKTKKPEAPSVAQQPQTLFAGRLEMVEGGAELHLDLPKRPTTLLVEVVVVADRDWRCRPIPTSTCR